MHYRLEEILNVTSSYLFAVGRRCVVAHCVRVHQPSRIIDSALTVLATELCLL